MQPFVDMFRLQVGPLALIVRTTGAYLLLLFGFRLFGKRELGQVTVFDLAMVLLIANAVQNAMVGPDTSLLGGLIVAGALLVLNYFVARLQIRNRMLRNWVQGDPTVLVSNGDWHPHLLRREGLDKAEVEAAMRAHGILSVRDVRLAVLEANGHISVVSRDAKTLDVRARRHPRTTVSDDDE